MTQFKTLELERFPHRTVLLALAAIAAFAVDFVTKHVAVALEPDALLFHVSDRDPFGVGPTLIFVAAAASLLACALPARVVAVGAGVALGGAVGNLASRQWWSAYGGSPDFIPMGEGSTGNLADLFIAVGAGTMLIGSIAWFAWAIVTSSRRRHTAATPEARSPRPTP